MKAGELLSERFEIERSIGAGGMGEVFRARDRATGAPAAIKVISGDREHHTARFVREVELLAELSHPAIVRYIAHGETPAGELFLAMEWLDGEDLKVRLEREPLTMGESVELARRAAEALGAAHARGIVHRDLKPSNLFLPGGRIDQIKVLDFGIALREGRTQLTQAGTTVGTPGYMAPEQARAGGAVDARADVFALGSVLYQCLIGTPAFAGDSPMSILGKILFSDAPRVSSVWPEVPQDLDALVAQMLAKDPAQRPSDGASLAAALGALGPLSRAAAVAPRGRMAKPPAITGGERRFVAMVLLGVAEGAEDAAGIDLAMLRAIKPYGGRIEQLADGSTIVVLEAGPSQVATDQAAQAARCALALRGTAAGRPIGIAMGRLGMTMELSGGAIIDRASRLLVHAAAASGELVPIALDEMSAGLLDARFDVAEADGGHLLRGERALIQGARTLLGRPTSYVGRDWELGALTAIFEECSDEPEARVVIVTAAPGMGKSRLATELVSRVRQRGEDVAIWVGRGDSLRAGSTLDLLGQALRGALGIRGGEPLAERRAKLRAAVAERMPAADQQRVTEFLGELVGAPFPEENGLGEALRAARADAQLMSEQVRRAWLDFLGAETAVRPVLLVLDDLQWGDFGTVRFIDTALRERGDRPWMVLALARPEVYEVFPKLWADRQGVQEIRLKELGRKAGERLVRQVLGDAVGSDTIERLVKQADGNAFYLEELIRAVAEGKDRALPETVLAMVETRLARLPLEARRVLRAAAVFGEVCWESGVTLLLGGAMGVTMVGEWLGRLADQEVLAERPDSQFPGERELKFRHALLREGAYATLTDDDRRLGHRLAGEWLERRGEGDPMVLAGHFERGGEDAKAAGYYLRAAEQAMLISDADAAITRATLGLGCGPEGELRNALLGARCEARLVRFHTVGEAMPDAEELLRTAVPGSVPWALAITTYAQGALVAGRVSDVLATLERLRTVEPAPEAVAHVSLAFVVGICIVDAIGLVAHGTALEAQFREVIRAGGEQSPIGRLWWRAAEALRAAYAHEDPWTGLAHADAIRPLFEVTGSDHVVITMQLQRGMNLWYLGASAEAVSALESIPMADAVFGLGSSLRRLALALALADRGALDEARAVAAGLAEDGRAHHAPLEESRGRWALAEVLRRAGDLEGADREAAVALAMSGPFEQPGVLGTIAMIRLAQGRAGEALAGAEDAVARCATMGGCGMFRGAFVRLAHAEALHATGDHDAAGRAIAEARARLREIAGRIPDPAYRQTFLEGAPENARTLALARAWIGEDDPADPSSTP